VYRRRRWSDGSSVYKWVNVLAPRTGDLLRRLHGLRNENCQSYHHCPQLPPTPHRLASAVPAIIQTMNDGVSQRVDKYFKILQTLLPFITDFPSVHGRIRTNVRAFVLCSLCFSLTDEPALLLCFRLHESRAAWCHPRHYANWPSSNVDGVVVEDRRMLSVNELQSTTLPARRHERLAPPRSSTSVC
jgi:hypothetical protein